MATLAWPPLSVPEPKVCPSDWKVTVPVGTPPYCPVTVAVKVTGTVTVPGFIDEVSTVAVVAWFTFCVSGEDVLDAKFEEPPYVAVSECEPALSKDVLNAATPLVRFFVPIGLFPS